MFIPRQLAALAALAISFSAAADTIEYPYVDVVLDPEFKLVGEVSPGCGEVLYKKKPSKAPPGFKISAEEAVALAEKAIEIDCSSESQRYVRANAKSYMLINVRQLSSGGLVWTEAYIDGATGQVTKTTRFQWPPDKASSAVAPAQPAGKQ